MTRLYLPASVTSKIAARCTVCGKPFWEREIRRGGAYERHVVACAEEHAEDLRSAGDRLGWNGEDFGDGEYRRWVEKYAQEIIEGRKRM